MSTVTVMDWESRYNALAISFHQSQRLYAKEIQKQQEANRRKNLKLRGLRKHKLNSRAEIAAVRFEREMLRVERDRAEIEVMRLEAAMNRAASG